MKGLIEEEEENEQNGFLIRVHSRSFAVRIPLK